MMVIRDKGRGRRAILGWYNNCEKGKGNIGYGAFENLFDMARSSQKGIEYDT